MQYEIIDEFGYKDYGYLNDLIELMIKKFNIEGIFCITFVSEDKIHQINREYRNMDRSTDVISFALNDDSESISYINVLGDIFISIPNMKRQAIDYGHSEKRELSFLVVHGLLHLLGYDHMNDIDEKVMFDLQKEVLDEAGIKK